VIVTRKRKKPFPLKRLLLPAIAIALAIFAFSWGPSRNAMSSGPMGPVVRTTGAWFDTIAAPFHFAAQNQIITAQNRQIAALQSQVAAAKSESQSKEKTIADLQTQLNEAQTQLASASGNAAQAVGRGASLGHGTPRPGPSVLGLTGGTNVALAGSDLTSGATPDMKRTADYWAAMDPENAAKVAQRLPPAYVARILALMPAESAGTILDNLPPSFAAKLTQEHPELKR
jgi:flagellar motility protein MotE (MotC chaperone)